MRIDRNWQSLEAQVFWGGPMAQPWLGWALAREASLLGGVQWQTRCEVSAITVEFASVTDTEAIEKQVNS